MQREVPTWLAVVAILIVIVIAAAIYIWRERATPPLPPLPMKEKLKAPGGPQTGPVPPMQQGFPQSAPR